MADQYSEGFIAKCAEAGLDPEQLVKTAFKGEAFRKLILGGIRSGAKGMDDIPQLAAHLRKFPQDRRAAERIFNVYQPGGGTPTGAISGGGGSSPGVVRSQTQRPNWQDVAGGQPSRSQGAQRAYPLANSPTNLPAVRDPRIISQIPGPSMWDRIRGVAGNRGVQIGAGAGLAGYGLGAMGGDAPAQGPYGTPGSPAEANGLQRLWDQHAQDYMDRDYPSYVGHRS
jgi:hypothetical protein